MKPREAIRKIISPASHWNLAVLMLAGMLAAWALRSWPGHARSSGILLLVVIVAASLPLFLELGREIAKGNFGVDVLALLSIGSAVALRQYWVAAIVILMLSGGKALEEYATRRASSVLGALARRMPQLAHRVGADGTTSDVAADAVAVGDRIVLHPHELCPVDGVVTQGRSTMDESYLTGEPFLIAKAPGATVLSGAVNGDAVLTIQATRVAGDSRYAKIVEVLHASEENRPQMRRLGDRLGSWYTPLAVGIALTS